MVCGPAPVEASSVAGTFRSQWLPCSPTQGGRAVEARPAVTASRLATWRPVAPVRIQAGAVAYGQPVTDSIVVQGPLACEAPCRPRFSGRGRDRHLAIGPSCPDRREASSAGRRASEPRPARQAQAPAIAGSCPRRSRSPGFCFRPRLPAAGASAPPSWTGWHQRQPAIARYRFRLPVPAAPRHRPLRSGAERASAVRCPPAGRRGRARARVGGVRLRCPARSGQRQTRRAGRPYTRLRSPHQQNGPPHRRCARGHG